MRGAFRRRRRDGFTLIELLVVCAVIGVLAAIAIPGFRAQVMRSRASEAPQVLAAIRQAQEAYFAIYSRYCHAPDANPSAPAPNPGDVAAFDTAAANWDQLGVNPGGPVRFQYQVLAGEPGEPVPGGIAGYNGTEHWYVSRARADLDGDNQFVVFEGYSISPRFYIGRGTPGDWTPGAYLAQGWE